MTEVNRRIALAVLLAGVVLRVALYLTNPSFYMDEAALQLSVRERPLEDLIGRPLAFGQTAPVLHLVLQRSALVWLGDHELVSRLVPLLAGIAALLLFAAFAYRCLPPLGAHVAVGLLAFSNPAIYFSASAKPYALDLLGGVAAITAGWLLLRPDRSRIHVGLAAAAGLLIPWFSIPGAIVTAGVGAAVTLLSVRRRGRQSLPSLGVVGVWAISAVLALAVTHAAQAPEGREYLHAFWSRGFPALPPRTFADWFWLPRTAVLFTMDPLGSWMPVAALFAIVYGAWWLARHDRPLLALTAGPFAVALLASGLGLYPFGGGFRDFYPGRVSLMLVPAGLLLVGAGVWHLRERLGARSRFFSGFTVVLLLSGSLPAAAAFLEPEEDVRGVLREIDARALPGDEVYVSYRAQHVVRWYAPRLRPDVSLVWGACVHYQSAEAAREIEHLRPGGRVWVVFSHPYDPSENRVLREVLDRSAERLDSVRLANADAYLYRLPRPLPSDLPDAPLVYDRNCGVFYPHEPMRRVETAPAADAARLGRARAAPATRVPS